MTFQHLRAVIASLLLLLAVALPASAAVDRAVCSASDSGGVSCTAAQLKTNINEEVNAVDARAVMPLASVSGTNTITATFTPTLTAYANGNTFYLKPANTITGAATLNINSIGAKSILSVAGAALASGDLRSDTIYLLTYYSTSDHFRVLTALGAGGTATGAAGGDLTGTYPNPTVAANSVALTTDTTGNYVADVADGTGIDGTASGEGTTYTPTLDLTEINSTVFGSGTFTTLGFNAGAVDPVFTFGSGTFDISAITVMSLDDEAEFRLFEEDAGGSNYVGFKAPAALTASVTCTMENDSSPIPDSCVGNGSDADTLGSDGDKGDITVGGTGTTLAIDAGAVNDTALAAGAVDGGVGGEIADDSITADDIAAGAVGTSEAAALDTADVTTGTWADARVDGSLEADEVNPTLGTQTAGNYVSGLTASTGVAISHTPGEGSTGTFSFDFTDAGASPSLNADECRFSGDATSNGEIVCEGDTADAFESRVVITDPTADRVFTIPNADSVATQPITCGGTDKVSAISALGVVTCTADSGAAGGDSVTVNGSATADPDFDDVTPAAVSGANVLWQYSAGNLSGYIPASSATVVGSVELATTTEAETGTDTTRAVTAAGLLTAFSGKKTIYVPAGAMIAETTTGCAAGTVESATSLVMYKTMDCDGAGSLQEGVQFMIGMPKSWDEGTLTFRVDWTAASGTGDVIWLFSCAAYSNDDALATANFGSEVSVTDTVLTALDVHQATESGAVTAGGTPAEGDNLWCRIQRDGDNASDTLNSVDARLLGVRILYTTNAMTDD